MLEKLILYWETETGKIIITTVIYILFCIVSIKVINFILRLLSNKIDKNAIHWSFIKKIVKTILITISAIGIISAIPGLDGFVTTIVASSTVIVAALGLASQESMSNVISGMFISIFKPFAVGDRIKLVSYGLVGMVEDINLRHTIIRTIENNRLIIPNTTMNKEIVENFNYADSRVCNFLDVKISLDSDIDKAKEILRAEIDTHPSHIDWRSEEDKANNLPLANILVRNISDECIELRVGVWASDVGVSFRMCSEIRQNIVNNFKRNNIKLYQKVIILDSQKTPFTKQ